MPRNPDCTICKLHKTSPNICQWGSGGNHPIVLFVFDAPFDNKSLRIIKRWAEQLSLTPDQYYITCAVKCIPTTKTPGIAVIESCRPYLQEEIASLKPEFIVMLGHQAIRAVTGRDEAVRAVRGRRNWYLNAPRGIKLLGTYPPADVLKNPKLADSVVDDLNRIAFDDFVPAELVRWEYVREVKRLPSLLAFDLETTGLNPWGKGKILCVSWSGSKNRAHVSDDILGFVTTVLRDKPLLIGHNIKFDILWPYAKYGSMMTATHDTKLMAHLLNENDQTGLKYLAGNLTGYGDWLPDYRDMVYAGRGEEIPKDKLFEYCAYDSAATWRLFNIFRPELRKQKLLPLYTAYMETINTFCLMEANGMKVDREMLNLLKAEFLERIAALEIILQRKVKEYGTINFSSNLQLQQLFFGHLGLVPSRKTKTGASVDEKSLRALYAQTPANMGERQFHNLLDGILELRGAKKIVSTYLEAIEEKLIKTERDTIHAVFSLTNSVSRVSCSGPNLQNIPRDANAPVKKIYVPKDGNILVSADYSQIELRMGAFITRDENMLEVIRAGKDLHDDAARQIFGEDFTKEQRSFAKTINFGIFYGMGPYKLAEMLKITTREAKQFIHRWYEAYPGVRAWQADQKQRLQDHGYVTSIFGRRRRLPTVIHGTKQEYAEAIRQACNFPIQSSATDICLFAMNAIRSYQGYSIICNVHDAVMFEIPKICFTRSHVLAIKSVMENATELCHKAGFKKITIDVPTPVDIEYGSRWGELKKWEES